MEIFGVIYKQTWPFRVVIKWACGFTDGRNQAFVETDIDPGRIVKVWIRAVSGESYFFLHSSEQFTLRKEKQQWEMGCQSELCYPGP